MVEEVRVRSKEKKHCGKLLEELQSMSIKDYSIYLPSRSRRSILRHPETIEKFVKSCEEKIKLKKKIKTHLRDIVIVPKMVGMLMAVHDGKSFQNIEIDIEMIGHRLGEFAMTRKRVGHSGAGRSSKK
jgi:small subunit ribosomal protein S19